METILKEQVRKLGGEIDFKSIQLLSLLNRVDHRFLPEGVENIDDLETDEFDPIDELPRITFWEKEDLIVDYVVKEISNGVAICEGLYHNSHIKRMEIKLSNLTIGELVDISTKMF